MDRWARDGKSEDCTPQEGIGGSWYACQSSKAIQRAGERWRAVLLSPGLDELERRRGGLLQAALCSVAMCRHCMLVIDLLSTDVLAVFRFGQSYRTQCTLAVMSTVDGRVELVSPASFCGEESFDR